MDLVSLITNGYVTPESESSVTVIAIEQINLVTEEDLLTAIILNEEINAEVVEVTSFGIDEEEIVSEITEDFITSYIKEEI